MLEEFLPRVRHAISAHRLLPRGGRLLVAVSGGADSVALLYVLKALQAAFRFVLHVGHLDHALRSDSCEDSTFVQDLAARWEIPAIVERRDVAMICAREGWSLEDGARRVRYDVLLAMARRTSASHIVFAHTADDQAETVLMRLMRGTGLMGLSAIPMKRQHEDLCVVRPFLEIWRRDILAVLTSEHVPYREDTTNADGRFVRNRIRHQLLPLLEREYNPNIKVALTQLAEQSAVDYMYLQDAAGRYWKRIVKTAGAAQSLSEGRPGLPGAREPHRSSATGRSRIPVNSSTARSHSAEAPPAVSIVVLTFLHQPKALQRQLLRRVIHRVQGHLNGFEYRHWLEAERLFLERPVGTVLNLPGGVQLRREKEHVVCRHLTNQAEGILPE